MAKLWETAFRMIWSISLFDAEKIFCANNFGVDFFVQETGVLEEQRGLERHWQMRRKKLMPVVRSFLGRVPCRRGTRLNMCRNPRLGTENDFNHLVV